MVVSIAHDYCTQRGGAERVALTLLQAFPEAELITSLHAGEHTFAGFGDYAVRTSHLQRYSAFRRDPRHAFPFLAAAWDRMHASEASAVVCSSSGSAASQSCCVTASSTHGTAGSRRRRAGMRSSSVGGRRPDGLDPFRADQG